MYDYGTVMYNGKEHTLQEQPDFTNRLLPSFYTNFHEAHDGERFHFELSARAYDGNGSECVVYWIFSDTKGEQQELEDYNYDEATRVDYL